jgi:hypothetical protein
MRAIYKQRLLKLADFIERTPVPNVKFDMTEYFEPRGLCGTAACIAGHAVIMKHTHGGRRSFNPGAVYRAVGGCGMPGVSLVAAEYLGLSEEQAGRLFLGYAPLRLIEPITAKQAAKVIRRFARTGVIRWNPEIDSFMDEYEEIERSCT